MGGEGDLGIVCKELPRGLNPEAGVGSEHLVQHPALILEERMGLPESVHAHRGAEIPFPTGAE